MDTCRLCLLKICEDNPHLIFDENSDTLLKILTCLPLRLMEGDGLPNKICNLCYITVSEFYCFRNKVMESANKLQATNNEITLNVNEKTFELTNNISSKLFLKQETANRYLSCHHTVSTQTENFATLFNLNNIKEEIIEDNFSDRDHLEGIPIKDEDSFNRSDHDMPIWSSIDADFINDNNKIKASISNSFESNLHRTKKRSKTKVKLKKKSKGESSECTLESFDDAENIWSRIKLKKRSKSELPDYKDLGTDNESDSNDIWSEIKLKKKIKKEEDPDYGASNVVDDVNDIWGCCICFNKYNGKERLLNHYRTHCEPTYRILNNDQERTIFSCVECNQNFESRYTFKKHFARHDNFKHYKCSLCEKAYNNPAEILKHGKTAHTNQLMSNDSNNDIKAPKPTSKRFICDLCDEKFVYMKYLFAHRNATHPEAKNCRFVYRCMYCKTELAHLNSLRRHLRTHTGEKNYLCCICGKALSSKEHLTFHMRIHTGFKPNICKTCGKSFVKKCNLVLHERVHSGERPHICSHCGKGFSQRSTLVIHERYHSGSRPYMCNLCNKGFVAKGLLTMHQKSCISI